MSFDKIKIISTRLKYGVSPSPADEVEQHVTIWSNGEVKISRYVFGDIRSGYVKAWPDTFYITKPDVENIFEHISMYFAENYEKKKKKDNPGCWEMTVTMEDGMRKKIRGHLCHDEYEAGDIELSRLIRETLARPYPLWLFNGRLEEGRGRYVLRVETKDGSRLYVTDDESIREGDTVLLPAGIDGQKMEGTVTARKPYQESEASKVLYSLSTISGRIERLQEEA